jgi:hypothetical protein
VKRPQSARSKKARQKRPLSPHAARLFYCSHTV